MSNPENMKSGEKMSPQEVLARFDDILSDEKIKAMIDSIANDRGWSIDILKNSIELFTEDHPANERLLQLLSVIEHPGDDTEAYQAKIEELLDLVA